MGYGGADLSSGVAAKQTADGGIDGIVHEDKLGFDSIYIQAKHWDPERTVSRPEVQGFAGALAGYGANKGLFITTAHFSEGARGRLAPAFDTRPEIMTFWQVSQVRPAK